MNSQVGGGLIDAGRRDALGNASIQLPNTPAVACRSASSVLATSSATAAIGQASSCPVVRSVPAAAKVS